MASLARLQCAIEPIARFMNAFTGFLVVAAGLISTASTLIAAPVPQPVRIARADLPYGEILVDAGARVAAVNVAGVTQYAPRDLLNFAVAHDLRTHQHSTVTGLLEAIELIYREDGFLLAEASLGRADTDDTLSIEVREGSLESLLIEGFRPQTAEQIRAYVEPLAGKGPIRSRDFERALLLASDLTGVYVRSEFQPTVDGDGYRLRLSGTEVTSAGSFTLDTVPVVDDVAPRAYLNEELYGLAKGGDMLRLFGVYSRESGRSDSFAGTVFYRVPVGASGAYIETFGGNAIAQRHFSGVAGDTDQRGLNLAVAVGHPLIRNLHDYLYLIAEFTHNDATSRQDGADLDSTASVARAYVVQGITRPDGDLLQWSLQVAHGMRPDRSSSQAPDGGKHFSYLRAGIGTVTALPAFSDRAFLRFEVTGQWTADSLPEVERIGLGFQPHLRGYSPWEAEGDRGYGAAVELSYIRPMTQSTLRELMPFAFVDFGSAQLLEPAATQRSHDDLAALGAGIRCTFSSGFSASGWIGVPLRDAAFTDAGDAAFYIRLSRGW